MGEGKGLPEAVASKMSAMRTSIFFTKEEKKEERHKLMLDAQNKKIDWDQERVNNK